MATKKKSPAKPANKAVSLGPVHKTTPMCRMATSIAVAPEDAQAYLDRGWLLTQHDDNLTVVACPSSIAETEGL